MNNTCIGNGSCARPCRTTLSWPNCHSFFCEPNDPNQVRYWYLLLGGIHVTFAVCSANGRVLAAVDLAGDGHAAPTRITQIKQAVLSACRVRYLRCPADHLPSIPELQMLVPQSAVSTRGPQPAPGGQPGAHDIGQLGRIAPSASAPRCGRIPASSMIRSSHQTRVRQRPAAACWAHWNRYWPMTGLSPNRPRCRPT